MLTFMLISSLLYSLIGNLQMWCMCDNTHDSRLQFKYPSSFLFIHDTFYVATKYMFSGETFSQLNGIQLENLKDISA